MKHRRRIIAVAALATTLAAWPMAAAAQELPAAATNDPLVVIGWQDDQTGAIYGHQSDLEAVLRAQRDKQVQAQIDANPDLMAGAIDGWKG